MAWVMDTYAMHVRQATTAVVTGKPLELGGSQGRKEATGRGVMICCDKAVAKLKMKREGCRVIVQGFGNVGSQAALADAPGRLQNHRRRRHPRRPLQRKGPRHSQSSTTGCTRRRRPLAGISRAAKKPTSREILFRPCDILIPAATENQITAENAARVDCRILCEGANGPTTWHADRHHRQQRDLRHSRYSRQTPAASPSAISNGCRIARDFSGVRAK